MRRIILVILLIILCGILWSLPLYLCANFVLFLFKLPYHLTLLQSFGLCLLASVIHSLFSDNKGDKK